MVFAILFEKISATPLAGLLLDHFQEVGNDSGIQCLGYTGKKKIFFFFFFFLLTTASY